MSVVVTPLDPDSPKGREVSERMSQILAEISLAIAKREAAAAREAAERSAA